VRPCCESSIRLDVYVWPLRLVRADGNGRLLVRQALGGVATWERGSLIRMRTCFAVTGNTTGRSLQWKHAHCGGEATALRR